MYNIYDNFDNYFGQGVKHNIAINILKTLIKSAVAEEICNISNAFFNLWEGLTRHNKSLN